MGLIISSIIYLILIYGYRLYSKSKEPEFDAEIRNGVLIANRDIESGELICVEINL